jgi:tetratricopeptide (TPR) repeat protein
VRLTVAVILSAGAAWTQRYPARTVPVHGEIASSTSFSSSLAVELTPQASGITERTSVNPDGSFELRSVPPGTYELRVFSDGQILYREMVSITANNQNLTVRLPERSNSGSASRSTESSISMAQLQHKIPVRAQKVFSKGDEALAKRNLVQACDYYRQAVALDAGFVDAYAQLGAAEANLGHLREAAEQLQKAIDLAPGHRLALSNLTIVLAKMRRFHEAGEVARRALKVAPSAGRIHYILAASLIEENGDMDEAIDHMQRAGADIPSAHLVAADLLLERGRRNEAVRQIEEYLLVAPATDALRPKAEARLSQLQRQ